MVWHFSKIRTLGDDLKEGDVILSNHPSAGGTHLPDLTVITPVRKIILSVVSFRFRGWFGNKLVACFDLHQTSV